MAATKKITADVLGVLASLEISQHGVVGDYHVACITYGQLPRDLYISVDKALKAMGGKWDRRYKGHVFDSNPSDAIEQAVMTGEYTDRKQALQFFETPEALAKQLVEDAYILNHHRVLEPSAGRGRIVRAIVKACNLATVEAVELDSDHVAHLRSSAKQPIIAIWNCDFLNWKPLASYDRVVMNPPFSKRQDVDHVTRAFSMLCPGGRLVSVVSGSALHRIDKKGEAFKALVKQCGRSYDLPEGTFQESGTMVRASVVILNKE